MKKVTVNLAKVYNWYENSQNTEVRHSSSTACDIIVGL